MTYVYFLEAEGYIDSFGGSPHSERTSTCFSTPERASARIEKFKSIVCSKERVLSLDLETVKIKVVPMEVVE